MKIKEMIERVQQHHTDMNITEVVRGINDAMNDMGFKAELVESADQFVTVISQRVYKLKDHIIKVKSVDYDGETIKKLVGRPIVRDLS